MNSFLCMNTSCKARSFKKPWPNIVRQESEVAPNCPVCNTLMVTKDSQKNSYKYKKNGVTRTQ